MNEGQIVSIEKAEQCMAVDASFLVVYDGVICRKSGGVIQKQGKDGKWSKHDGWGSTVSLASICQDDSDTYTSVCQPPLTIEKEIEILKTRVNAIAGPPPEDGQPIGPPPSM